MGLVDIELRAADPQGALGRRRVLGDGRTRCRPPNFGPRLTVDHHPDDTIQRAPIPCDVALASFNRYEVLAGAVLRVRHGVGCHGRLADRSTRRTRWRTGKAAARKRATSCEVPKQATHLRLALRDLSPVASQADEHGAAVDGEGWRAHDDEQGGDERFGHHFGPALATLQTSETGGAPSKPMSSGQIRCQSFGRRSQRITAPAVAFSMATQRSMGTTRRARHMDGALGATPTSRASDDTPPTRSIARARADMYEAPVITIVMIETTPM